MTDANGYDIVTRDVFKSESGPFASSFYPVDASITINDKAGKNALTVWNDRPQAGSVHAVDSSIKLLIDRKLETFDFGGINEVMDAYRRGTHLNLHFSLKMYPAEE